MSDIITLKALCEELKIDPREAREKLRKPRIVTENGSLRRPPVPVLVA